MKDCYVLNLYFFLFILTAIAEILGCYLPYLWLRQGKSPLLIIPGAICLFAFSCFSPYIRLARAKPTPLRGAYVFTAIFWTWLVEGQVPSVWDIVGGMVCLSGMAIIVFITARFSF